MPGVKLKHFLKFNKDESVISLSNVTYGFYGARYLNGEKELFNEKSGNIEQSSIFIQLCSVEDKSNALIFSVKVERFCCSIDRNDATRMKDLFKISVTTASIKF
ncbi:hypothetical protein KUTeg_006297 [Tegillarca granosa]|uniref:Uncharacterized protein n=1 Tax=Tegillarca granosa TaxID=220873 RepID=A0ABQ9FG25_TEGGR|nr:hypothetical protein KUTeg_006297 [Tegillarca granosa]